MRTLACFMILAAALAAGCQSTPSNSPAVHATTQPQGPLDQVTNPLNQPNIDSHGMAR